MVTITPKISQDMAQPQTEVDYPYGTELSFRDDLFDAIGGDSLNVNDVVAVRGMAKVVRRSEHEDGEGIEKSVCIQMTDITVTPTTPDRATVLYVSDNNDD